MKLNEFTPLTSEALYTAVNILDCQEESRRGEAFAILNRIARMLDIVSGQEADYDAKANDEKEEIFLVEDSEQARIVYDELFGDE